MTIRCVWEHNGEDTLLYADNVIGAYARGASLREALAKMPREITRYLRWCGQPIPNDLTPLVVQQKASTLCIADADSDVLFDSEHGVLCAEDYTTLKALALRSAADFEQLYAHVPDKDKSVLSPRETFYGAVPRTARAMYEHTKNVNAYYFGEIGIDADNSGTIAECRARGFARLEQRPDFLENPVFEGSYGEQWSLKKLLRRFLWHDRIHAKAMTRMAIATFGRDAVKDVFHIDD